MPTGVFEIADRIAAVGPIAAENSAAGVAAGRTIAEAAHTEHFDSAEKIVVVVVADVKVAVEQTEELAEHNFALAAVAVVIAVDNFVAAVAAVDCVEAMADPAAAVMPRQLEDYAAELPTAAEVAVDPVLEQLVLALKSAARLV